jgi:hypothetical protein
MSDLVRERHVIRAGEEKHRALPVRLHVSARQGGGGGLEIAICDLNRPRRATYAPSRRSQPLVFAHCDSDRRPRAGLRVWGPSPGNR